MVLYKFDYNNITDGHGLRKCLKVIFLNESVLYNNWPRLYGAMTLCTWC